MKVTKSQHKIILTMHYSEKQSCFLILTTALQPLHYIYLYILQKTFSDKQVTSFHLHYNGVNHHLLLKTIYYHSSFTQYLS